MALCPETPGQDVGAYNILPGNLSAGPNYNLLFNFVGEHFTIFRRPITVTADSGQTKIYGEDDPTPFTYQVTSGTLAFSDHLDRQPDPCLGGEDVGTYAITQGTLALGSNYDLTFVGADFTITTRAITVTADAKTKVYADADPPLTYQITTGSLVSPDTFVGSLTRDPGEGVGAYAITRGTLALSSNYVLTFVGGALTVTLAPAAVSIISDSPDPSTAGNNVSIQYSVTGAGVIGGTVTITDADTTGICTASIAAASCQVFETAAGLHHFTATYNGDANHGTATSLVETHQINAAALHHINISPSSSIITAGGSQAYVITAFDLYDNLIGDVTASTGLVIAGDGSCGIGSCTATIAGLHVVTATYLTKTAIAPLTVNPAGLDHLILSPANSSILSGGSQAYTAVGVDTYGNAVTLGGTTTYGIAPDGSCTLATCTATTNGPHTVTGTNATKTGQATLNVSGGDTTPPTVTSIAAGRFESDERRHRPVERHVHRAGHRRRRDGLRPGQCRPWRLADRHPGLRFGLQLHGHGLDRVRQRVPRSEPGR